jgi:hypothetical protein
MRNARDRRVGPTEQQGGARINRAEEFVLVVQT